VDLLEWNVKDQFTPLYCLNEYDYFINNRPLWPKGARAVTVSYPGSK